MKKKISILWKQPPGKGSFTLTHADTDAKIQLSPMQIGHRWGEFDLEQKCRIDIEISGAHTDPGPYATIIGVKTPRNSFSFFLRDVRKETPIYIPQYGVAVTDACDSRSYDDISTEITYSGRQTKLREIDSLPEASFDTVAHLTRDLKCVTWLGLSRDIRNFEINFHYMKSASDVWDSVKPKFHGMDVMLPELEGKPVQYDYFCGRGIGCISDRKRWLEKGVLPILNACLSDGDISYEYKIFTTMEVSPLEAENIRGTHYLVADRYAYGSMFTDEQTKSCDQIFDSEMNNKEETVCFVRVEAVNRGTAPQYSMMRLPQPNVYTAPDLFKVPVRYNPKTGFGSYSEDRVFLIAQLNGKPVPSIEMSALLAPGEKAEYVFKIPHRPISAARADALLKRSFDEKLEECTAYWESKLDSMASLDLPEKRIGEMMKAGMLHCDLITYGREPGGAVAPTVGIYSPIGSESAPIIQYLDSVGLHDLARRAILYFVERQHDDGFMQNCGGYMLETGCVLWTMGEHWRYTRDVQWVRSVRDNIVKAVDFLIAWRNRNKREELRGRGYGMINGKVADCEDNYHIFMLNSTAYIGIKRAAEMLAATGDLQASRISQEAADFLGDIRASLDEAFALAPAVPLRDGSWCPSMPVWTEAQGALFLHADGGLWFSHGTALARDILVSTQYLILDEVIDPHHAYADFILNYLADNCFIRNTCLSQPYYSPHPWANLKRGEVKAFLEEFYVNMSSLADRETYTFWEHYFYASPHKTHEEAWFLMRCRWMLYLESEDTLSILPGVPRAWLEDGKIISVTGVSCYFGKLSFQVISDMTAGKVEVHIKLDSTPERMPRKLAVRIPHPQGLKASHTSSGYYDPEKETVLFDSCQQQNSFTVSF